MATGCENWWAQCSSGMEALGSALCDDQGLHVGIILAQFVLSATGALRALLLYTVIKWLPSSQPNENGWWLTLAAVLLLNLNSVGFTIRNRMHAHLKVSHFRRRKVSNC